MSTLFTGLDIETTGLDFGKGHRIIEINMQIWRLEDRKRLINWTRRINNQGKPIDKKAREVHGISEADLVGCSAFKDYAPMIGSILKKYDALIIHNAPFDAPFLAYEMNQAGQIFSEDLAVFDTMSDGMFASYDAKPPTLGELCWALGVPYDASKAHAADYDVDVMMQAFFNGVDQGYFDITSITTAKEKAA